MKRTVPVFILACLVFSGCLHFLEMKTYTIDEGSVGSGNSELLSDLTTQLLERFGFEGGEIDWDTGNYDLREIVDDDLGRSRMLVMMSDGSSVVPGGQDDTRMKVIIRVDGRRISEFPDGMRIVRFIETYLSEIDDSKVEVEEFSGTVRDPLMRHSTY